VVRDEPRAAGALPLVSVAALFLLVVTALQLSARLRADLEAELTERLRISASLVTEVLTERGARPADTLDPATAARLEEIREATSVSDIVLYDRQGGFLGGSISGPAPGAVPRRLRLGESDPGHAPAGPADRVPERDPAGGLTLVVPLDAESGGGALLARIDRESQGSLAGVDLFFSTAKVLAAFVFAAGILILLRWAARGGSEPAPARAGLATGSDVDMVLGTMKEVMTTLKDSETDWRDRWTAAEADADRWRRTSDLILESIESAIVAFDRAGRVTLFNRAAEELFGFAPRHAVGRDLAIVFGEADPLVRLGRDVLDSARSHRRVEMERPGPDGEPLWLGVASSVIRSREGKEIGGLLLLADLTETRRLREGAALKDRLSAVGEMAAAVAHEIKNCLHSMSGFENLLRDDLRGEEPTMAVQGILSEAHALETLVKGMLQFSRPSTLSPEPCDVARLVAEVAESLGETARAAGVAVEVEGADERHEAEVDPGALRGVFRNLGLNAVEAMTEGGTLTIGVRAVDLPEDRGEGALAGPCVRVSFRDTGPGIAEEDRARVFTPFWTSKSEGTGLGLALVHKTVTDHGGRLQLHSRVGVGTEFVLLLPRERP
jgi:PAS domain S-box-containing protein